MKLKNWIQKIIISLFVLFSATNLFAFSPDCTRDASGDSFLAPEKFESGQPANAEAVNKNFDCVYQVVDNIEKGVTVEHEQGSNKITLNGSVNFNGLHMLVITGYSCPDKPWEAVVEHKELTTPRRGMNSRQSGSFEIIANFSHCGGGCHYAFRHLNVLFNDYDGQFILSNIEKNGNGAGAWSLQRLKTIDHGNGMSSSNRFKLERSVGTTNPSFCGPVDIRIFSNYPMSLVSKSEY